MKFEEALRLLTQNPKKSMFNKEHSYKLRFENNFLTINDFLDNTLSPYVIHLCDFDYDWEVH